MTSLEFNPDRAETACFTGHRVIPAKDAASLSDRVYASAQQAYESGYRTFLCGGARGFDTIAAREILRLRTLHPDIRLVIAVPCATQADRWNTADRKAYQEILAAADGTVVLSPDYYDGCMQARNRFMVDRSSLCLCYMTRFEGGTWFTVRYALHEGITLKNLAMKNADPSVLKENAWNCISISHSVSGNANTVRLSRFRHLKHKKKNI